MLGPRLATGLLAVVGAAAIVAVLTSDMAGSALQRALPADLGTVDGPADGEGVELDEETGPRPPAAEAPPASGKGSGGSGGSGGGSGTFEAAFTEVRGHGFWIQAKVTAKGGSVAKVDARLDGGEYKPLALKPWGVWASDLHIVQGTLVELRATSATGATAMAGCYRWIPPAHADAVLGPCTAAAPPVRWSSRGLATFDGRGPSDMASGDVDRDGKAEVYVAEASGLFRSTADGLVEVSPRRDWQRLAVGDGDGDGKAEIYATRLIAEQGVPELRRLAWTGKAWTDDLLLASPGSSYGDVAVGRPGTLSKPHVYLSLVDRTGNLVEFTESGGTWTAREVWDFGGDARGVDVRDLVVADADGDAAHELVVLTHDLDSTDLWVFEVDGSVFGRPEWKATGIPRGLDSPTGLVVADVDHKGGPEIVTPGWEGDLQMFRLREGKWVLEEVSLGGQDAFVHVTYGDGDGDGQGELYLTSFGGRSYVARLEGGAWTLTSLGEAPGGRPAGGPVAVGSAPGDGRQVVVASYDLDTWESSVVTFRAA